MITKMTNIIYLALVLISFLTVTKSVGINTMNDRILAQKATQEKEIIPDNSLSQFSNSECDLITDGPICLYNGDRVLLPYATPKGLIGYWNFDEIKALDNSGLKNHAINTVQAGTSFGGVGASGFFNDGNYLEVPFNESFRSNEFTITFWFFVIQDFFSSSKGTRYCPIIQRGNDDLYAKSFQRAPALYLDRSSKNLKFYVKTNAEDQTQGEVLTSNAKVTNQRWLHIALLKTDNKLKLYVNGILDNQMIIKSNMDINNNSLYIGNVPWLKDQCNFPFLIDELRYYNKSIEEDFIQAEASPVLGGIEPSFLQLGCLECSLKEASQACVEGYRLCTSIELHTGGYQIARSMGWLNWNTHLWTHGALKTPTDFENLKGLALCCAELK